MSKKILQRQNKELRVRLANLRAKKEISEQELKEKTNSLSRKLRDQNGQIKMLQQYIVDREKKFDELTESLRAQEKKIAELTEEVLTLRNQRDKFKAMLGKNSANSSKPPSTDGFRKAKAVSNRQKSGKKPGGQPGHPGHTVIPFPNPTKIVEQRPPAICSCGGQISCRPQYTPKQVADIKIEVEITEERRFDGKCTICGKFHRGEFSAGFVNPVQYGSNVKSLVAILNGYGNVPVNKTVEILNGISGSLLNLSEATVLNFQKSLTANLHETVEIIKERLIACNVLGADETGCRINGKLSWMQVFSNSQYTLFGLNKKRGSLHADEMDILSFFTGILIHDHFKAYYGYKQITHAECNVHILRYLQAVIEIMKHPWATEMANLLRKANKLKKNYLSGGRYFMDEYELLLISVLYDEVLKEGKAQYEEAIKNKINISYYKEERLLLKRLAEYKEEHLRFLTNFEVPFDNNGSERDIRLFKNKTKVSGGFRSEEGARNYAIIASLISTLRKQDINIYLAFRDSFNGNPPKFDSAYSSGYG